MLLVGEVGESRIQEPRAEPSDVDEPAGRKIGRRKEPRKKEQTDSDKLGPQSTDQALEVF